MRKVVGRIKNLREEVSLPKAFLEANTVLISTLFNSVPVMLLIIDEKGQVVEINQHARDILSQRYGIDVERVMGKNIIALLKPLHQQMAEKVSQALRTKEAFEVKDITFKTKRGIEFANIKGIPLRGPEDHPSGLLLVVEITTERRATEEHLLRSERLAAMGRMAAALAHEINNPLQAIQNTLELVLDFPLDEKEQRSYLRAMRTEIERLMDLTQRILNFARTPRRERRLTSITEAINQALALARKQLQYSHIEVRTHLPGDLPPVFASPDQLAQVFLNFIVNAIEVMPSGGRLTIEARELGGQIEVIFQDTGPAIPEELLPYVFEPFYPLRGENTDLGLAISHNIITQHRGVIRVENIPEGGVRFTIVLPAVEDIRIV